MLGCPLAQDLEQKCCPPTLIDRDSSTLRLQSEQSHKSKTAVITQLSVTTHLVYCIQGTISLAANRTLNIDLSKLILSSKPALLNVILKSIFEVLECDSQKHILIH
ncbi:hypothetical protein MITS9509_01018 [Synechococcus sp. MIT S9509]|nr:hypothetical protein MITS9509_01018 [Synechococcus sp. MIT S9509]